MEFLNLGFGQFLALFGVVSAMAVALYLLDRTRRRQVVSTLRFWVAPGQPAPVSRRHRIQQPMSLLLQLLGMALLLLAMSEFQFGGSLNKRRDHVLILDTSAWMGASLPGHADSTLMDSARANALGWLRAVPSTDRVLLVRADGLATPATAWETDHRKIVRAILESQPGSTALNLAQNLEFARELQQQSGAGMGEIVYSGPGRISSREANGMTAPAIAAFRVLTVDDALENSGIRSLGARRSGTSPGTWDVLVRVRNYGKAPRVVNVTLNYDKAPQGMHAVPLAPGAEQETTFTVHSLAAGILEARLYPKDGFAADNYALLELPQQRSLHVVVYSDRAESIKPALQSDPRVTPEFRARAAYTPANDGLVILDGFHPAVSPRGNALWIEGPSDNSSPGYPPIPVRARVDGPSALRWVADQPLTEGLRDSGIQVEGTSVFEPGPGEISVAEIDKGSVVIARGRSIFMGFNPFAGRMRYELATPILLGNILRWAAPDVFRDVDVTTQSVGAVSSPLSRQTDKNSVQVLTDSGTVLPFNIRDHAVQFFAGEPARVRVIAGASERVYSLTLPEMWDVKWSPPSGSRHGIPAWTETIRKNHVIWPFLAVAGAALLLIEWIVYGSYATARLRVVRQAVRA
ncbi:MAG: VWA domain-containing protein [Terriglobia bacterium]